MKYIILGVSLFGIVFSAEGMTSANVEGWSTRVDPTTLKQDMPTATVISEKDDLLSETLKNPLGHDLSIDEAVSKFEQQFKKNVLLPTYIPFNTSHTGGHYSDERLIISYYNENTKDKIKISMVHNGKLVYPKGSEELLLPDGTKAVYVSDEKRVANFLFFVKDGIEYQLGISKNFGLETLSKVAISMLYSGTEKGK